jgi:hypothetical protein
VRIVCARSVPVKLRAATAPDRTAARVATSAVRQVAVNFD